MTTSKKFYNDEIFNADEIGPFYKIMPGRTPKLKGEEKIDKLRINLHGSDEIERHKE